MYKINVFLSCVYRNKGNLRVSDAEGREIGVTAYVPDYWPKTLSRNCRYYNSILLYACKSSIAFTRVSLENRPHVRGQ